MDNIGPIDTFFTDLPLPPEMQQAFDAAGVEMLAARAY
jgi:hypothetical protein